MSTRGSSINVHQRSDHLALTEFNTWYVAGLARKLLSEGETQCQVYGAANPKWEHASCSTHEGAVYPVTDIISRSPNWVLATAGYALWKPFPTSRRSSASSSAWILTRTYLRDHPFSGRTPVFPCHPLRPWELPIKLPLARAWPSGVGGHLGER